MYNVADEILSFKKKMQSDIWEIFKGNKFSHADCVTPITQCPYKNEVYDVIKMF